MCRATTNAAKAPVAISTLPAPLELEVDGVVAAVVVLGVVTGEVNSTVGVGLAVLAVLEIAVVSEVSDALPEAVVAGTLPGITTVEPVMTVVPTTGTVVVSGAETMGVVKVPDDKPGTEAAGIDAVRTPEEDGTVTEAAVPVPTGTKVDRIHSAGVTVTVTVAALRPNRWKSEA